MSRSWKPPGALQTGQGSGAIGLLLGGGDGGSEKGVEQPGRFLAVAVRAARPIAVHLNPVVADGASVFLRWVVGEPAGGGEALIAAVAGADVDPAVVPVVRRVAVDPFAPLVALGTTEGLDDGALRP